MRQATRWYTALPIVLAASLFLLAGLAEAVPRIVHADVAVSSLGLADVLFDPPLPPQPSSTDPPYPLNHTLDGDPTVLGSPQNGDFETPPGSVGSPPTNSDLETGPADVVSVPNGDFETGTFANWTMVGSPTIESDQTHGYWARMGSDYQELKTAAIEIPRAPSHSSPTSTSRASGVKQGLDRQARLIHNYLKRERQSHLMITLTSGQNTRTTTPRDPKNTLSSPELSLLQAALG